MLLNLFFLEQKIHQLQAFLQFIVGQDKRAVNSIAGPQQQLVMADITSIIVQLISTAGNLLPSVNPVPGQLHSNMEHKPRGYPDQMGGCEHEQNLAGKPSPPIAHFEDAGSYTVLQLEEEEILAPHAHFCLICGKGFKRDANLRMHMRGHGDEYKTRTALAKPSMEPIVRRRYSCPYAGCKRNKDHEKFQPLKTMLCVQNHYKRTHCEKNYKCRRCNSKLFSVLADLRTHEKHCGLVKWLCSCGTSFSRKDKLFRHVALFKGHTPALSVEKSNGSRGTVKIGENHHEQSKIGSNDFSGSTSSPGGGGVHTVVDRKGSVDDTITFLSSCDFDRFHDFPPPPFDILDNSLSDCL